ncbi:MAG: hypothetical protein DMF70_06020, partial [Acidobacteria bacterium]
MNEVNSGARKMLSENKTVCESLYDAGSKRNTQIGCRDSSGGNSGIKASALLSGLNQLFQFV